MRQSFGWLWIFIVGGATLVAVLAWIICYFLTPDYRAETYLIMEKQSPFSMNKAAEDNQHLIDKQITSLKSDGLLSKVIVQLNLTEDTDFTSLRSVSSKQTPQEQAITTLRKNMHVSHIARSPMLVVQYKSPFPQQAAKIANTIAGEFIAVQNTASSEASHRIAEHDSQEIARLRAQLQRSQQELSDFQTTGKVPTVVSASRSPKSVFSDKQYSEAVTNAEDFRYALSTGLSLDLLPDMVLFDPIRSLIEQRDQLNAQIAEVSVSLLGNHPRLKNLQFQRTDLDRKIATEGQRLLGFLEEEVALLKADHEQLLELGAADSVVKGDDTTLRSLEDKVKTARKQVQDYQERYKDEKAGSSPITARIYSYADVPEKPYFPDTWSVVGIAFAVSVFLLTVFGLLWQSSRLPFYREDEKQAANADVLADGIAEPDSVLSAHVDDNYSTFSNITVPENPNSVEAIVEQIMAQRKKRIIVVSPEGDIASAGSVRLIRCLADHEKRVLLIDMTAYGTIGLAMLDGIEQAGITELLSGRRRFDGVIHNDRFSSAHVMPLGNVEPEIAMLSADRLPLILDALETVYDFVIVECGPSTTKQLHQIISGPATVIMSLVNPDDKAVVQAALHMDQDGFEDVIILLNEAGNRH